MKMQEMLSLEKGGRERERCDSNCNIFEIHKVIALNELQSFCSKYQLDRLSQGTSSLSIMNFVFITLAVFVFAHLKVNPFYMKSIASRVQFYTFRMLTF